MNCINCDGSGFIKTSKDRLIEHWRYEQYTGQEAFELYRLWKQLRETTKEGYIAYLPCRYCNEITYQEELENLYFQQSWRKRNQDINKDQLLDAIKDVVFARQLL